MNANTFIDRIIKLVIHSAIEDVISNLENPPGRNPDKNLIFMSKKYLELDDNQRELINLVTKDSVETAVFYFLSILDGVKKFDDSGELKLSFIENQDETLINDENLEFLHDILNRKLKPD